jgi:hypothetical protein
VILALTMPGNLCQAGTTLFDQDTYIWQLRWTPAVGEAVRDSADLVGRWRVLVAELDQAGRLRDAAPDHEVLRASGRPLVLVIRIDGRIGSWNEATLLPLLDRLQAAWQGDPVAGLELDYDCATARLADYGQVLAKVRAALDPKLRLSITALPAWLGSVDLDRVLGAVDETVLQVHAVRDPHAGLFDPDLALQWAGSLARRTDRPFRLALPAYGARVAWTAGGTIASVESEMPRLAGGQASELVVEPTMVAAFLRRLAGAAPPHLAGLVWFRLPTEEDERAWSPAAWRAVATGANVDARVVASLRPGAAAGALDLGVGNPGPVDTRLPRRVRVAGTCPLADAVNGYALRREGTNLLFERVRDGLLRPGRERAIGWIRCSPEHMEIDVEP